MGQCHLICFTKHQKSPSPSIEQIVILQNSQDSKDDQEIPQQPQDLDNFSQNSKQNKSNDLMNNSGEISIIIPKTMKDKFIQEQQKSIQSVLSSNNNNNKEDSDQENKEINTFQQLQMKKQPDASRVQSSDLLTIQNSELEIYSSELQKSSFCFEQIILEKKKMKNSEESKNNSGHGRFSTKDGTMNYEGYWSDNKQQGFGKESWKNGMFYEGDYSMGKKHGKGVIIFPNGGQYEGDFENNQYHGFGKLEHEEKMYEGNWVNGKKEGYGRMVWKINGEEYIGQFHENKRHGDGTFKWKDGKKYIGSWEKGQMAGHGILIYPNNESKNMMNGKIVQNQSQQQSLQQLQRQQQQ